VLRARPDVARFFGLQVDDGELRFTDPMARFWTGFVRFIGIFGVIVAVWLILQGIGKL
jgi:hypothetical protein